MKKIYGIILMILFAVIVAARLFFAFTPIWMDVIFIACIAVFLILLKLGKKESSGPKEQSHSK
jgi:membrane protein implicated in regulation of membrane protease activity